MSEKVKKPSTKTKERYDLFVTYYLQHFNATRAAIEVGYSEKTARQQGHKLLTNVYIQEKINNEMRRLRDRMKDEGLRSFSMMLDIAMQTEEKIQAHNTAEIEIIRINKLIDDISLQMADLNNERSNLQKAADAIDGRKSDMKEKKRGLSAQIETMDSESFELKKEQLKLYNERSVHEFHYLPTKDWEKLQNLKKSIFQDILDRGGFKAMDKVQHSGQVKVSNPFQGLTEEELRRLAYDQDD